MKEIVTIEDINGNKFELSEAIVRTSICTNPALTSQEIAMFLKLCEYQKLNPFLKEVYLIKYAANSPATMVTGIETLRKRAAHHPKYRGREITCDGIPPEMTATCKVYVHGYVVPVSCTVDWCEYVSEKDEWVNDKKTGRKIPNAMWATRGKTMLKKVAEAQALRSAFPDDFACMYVEEEVDPACSPESSNEIEISPYIVPEKGQTALPSPLTTENAVANEPQPKTITASQRRLLFAKAKSVQCPEPLLRAFLAEELQVIHTGEIKRDDFEKVLTWLDMQKTEVSPL